MTKINSNLKLIKSNTIPTVNNLQEGEMAFGIVSEENKLYGNIGSEIKDFNEVTDLEANDGEESKVRNPNLDIFYYSIVDNDILYVADTGATGVSIFDPITVSYKPTNLITETVRGFYKDHASDTLWVFGKGLWKLNRLTNNFDLFKADTEVFISMCAYKGILYFGYGSTKGIVRTTSKDNNTIIPTNMSGGYVRSIYHDSVNDELYFLFNGDGVWKLDASTGNIIRVPGSKNIGSFQTGFTSKAGVTYLLTNVNLPEGIFKINNTTKELETTNVTDKGFETVIVGPNEAVYCFVGNSNDVFKLNEITNNFDLISKDLDVPKFASRSVAYHDKSKTIYIGGTLGFYKIVNDNLSIIKLSGTKYGVVVYKDTIYYNDTSKGLLKLENGIYGRKRGRWLDLNLQFLRKDEVGDIIENLNSLYVINGYNNNISARSKGTLNISKVFDGYGEFGSLSISSDLNQQGKVIISASKYDSGVTMGESTITLDKDIHLNSNGLELGKAYYNGKEIATVDKILDSSKFVKNQSANPNDLIIGTYGGNVNINAIGLGYSMKLFSTGDIILEAGQKLYYNSKEVATKEDLASKQDKLISGTNIKTVNNTSLLGSGNISINLPIVTNIEDLIIPGTYIYRKYNGEDYGDSIVTVLTKYVESLGTLIYQHEIFGSTILERSKLDIDETWVNDWMDVTSFRRIPYGQLDSNVLMGVSKYGDGIIISSGLNQLLITNLGITVRNKNLGHWSDWSDFTLFYEFNADTNGKDLDMSRPISVYEFDYSEPIFDIEPINSKNGHIAKIIIQNTSTVQEVQVSYPVGSISNDHEDYVMIEPEGIAFIEIIKGKNNYFVNCNKNIGQVLW